MDEIKFRVGSVDYTVKEVDGLHGVLRDNDFGFMWEVGE
jgi:hypothetical protein